MFYYFPSASSANKNKCLDEQKFLLNFSPKTYFSNPILRKYPTIKWLHIIWLHIIWPHIISNNLYGPYHMTSEQYGAILLSFLTQNDTFLWPIDYGILEKVAVRLHIRSVFRLCNPIYECI